MLQRKIQIKNQQVKVLQDLSLSHAGTVWDGALTLIAYWDKNRHIAQNLFKNKNVIQLGSGTGITGLASLPFQPKELFLTDLPQYVKFLSQNAKLNKTNTKIHCQQLSWGNDDQLEKLPHIDTIIGSELAYDKQNVKMLMKTIRYLLKKNPQTQIMISYQNNKEEWKNFQLCFKEQVGAKYDIVSWSDMDQYYRDQFLKILYKMS